MTAQASNQDIGGKQHQIAQDAALIANFYGQRSQLQQLQDRLIQGLNLSLHDQEHGYTNTAHNAFLLYFDPPAPSAHDTSIIQLALNRSGPVQRAWKGMREQLEKTVPDDSALSAVWGYTLIYQAELVEESISVPVHDELLLAAWPLHPRLSEHSQKLAETGMPGGWIELIDIPLQGDGLQAATIYIALNLPHTNNQLVQSVLYNPASAFLMADLIAHKGYHQIRQYRLGNLIGQYRQRMDTLLKQAEDSMKTPAIVPNATVKLDDLGGGYSSLVIASVHLNALRVSLIRQTNDFRWWHKQVGGNDIVTFHQHHLEMASQELTLLLEEGQHPLDAAKMAVDVMRASLEQEQEHKQRRIEIFLATVAAALSALTLFDKEAASGLLGLVGVPQPVGILPVLGIQVCCMVAVVLLVMLVIRVVRVRHLR